MANVINKKERNTTLLKFIGFFIPTVLLILIAVFFDYQVPSHENDILQNQLDVFRQQEDNQEKFADRMQEAVSLLDSLDKTTVNTEQINLQLSGKISELAVMQQKDNTVYGRMDKVILDKLLELQEKKKRLSSLSEKAGNLPQMQAELEKCQNQLRDANAALDTYRRTAQ